MSKIRLLAAFVLALIVFCPGWRTASAQSVSASDLINLINGMRSANGLGALSVDYNLMACAQSTAETMAASHMTWHIGNVSGRASSFGYNNYNTCFATENFMVGGAGTTIAQVQAQWSDATHMIPAQSSSYCHIGAGVAQASDGLFYYVVQAAYPAGSKGCGYAAGTGNGAAAANGGGGASMVIQSVVTATPDEDGYIFHTVREGQTLWAIASAYNVSVRDLQAWNNMYNSSALSLDQKLYIPSQDEAGHTPTPAVELTVFPTADAQGKYHHVVSEGDTLWSISELWNVPLDTIYKANGMNANSSIGLGWEISIPVTATATLLPTDTPTPTPEPTETPEPPSPTASPDTQNDSDGGSQKTSGTILHLPGISSQTIIFGAALLLILAGSIFIALNTFLRKK